MKCAGELIAISLKVEEEKRLERERRAAEELRILEERTINWCEEIGEVLEKQAMDGQPLKYNVLLAKYSNTIFRTVKEVSSRYCDCREDYEINWDKLHLPTIIKFFEEYCFETVLEDFVIYSYGRGPLNACKITIKPAPQCF